MHPITGRKREFVRPLAFVLLCLIAIPCRLLGDENTTSETSKKATKVVGPVPLTERERLLLDRLEELEKRVADLEANKQAAMAPASAGNPTSTKAVAAPASADVASAAGTAASGASSLAAPAGGNAISTDTDKVMASVGPQATEKGKSGAAKPGKTEPFAFADFTWLNGNARTKEVPLDTKFFTPEIRADVDYNYSFNHPKDDTIGGSSEVFRHGEVQVTQLGVGGDFHYDNVRAG